MLILSFIDFTKYIKACTVIITEEDSLVIFTLHKGQDCARALLVCLILPAATEGERSFDGIPSFHSSHI